MGWIISDRKLLHHLVLQNWFVSWGCYYHKGTSIRQATAMSQTITENPMEVYYLDYNYTACCWFPTSSNILILPSQFWQIRFESYWLHCSKCRIYWCFYGTTASISHKICILVFRGYRRAPVFSTLNSAISNFQNELSELRWKY